MIKDKSKYQNYLMETYGQLKILEVYPVYKDDRKLPRNVYFAKCQCSCGNIKDIEIAGIIRKYVTSCGCRRDQYDKIRGANNVLYKGYKEVSSVYFGKLRRGALKRNLEFTITKKDIWDLYIKQNKKCALTGWNLSWDKREKLKCSVDRIDSSKGYTKDNIQIIERHLNVMKMALSQDEFILRCKIVTEYQGLKNAKN